MPSCTGLNVINPVCQLKGAVGSVATGVFDQIAHDFGQAAGDAVNWLWGQLAGATAVDLSGAGIKADLLATGAIAVVLTTILFLIQVIWSALRREPGGMVRAVRGLGVAFLGSAFAIACTQILLTLVDALSAGVVQFAMGTNIEGLGRKLIAVQAITAVNPAAQLLLALVVIAAVVMVWVALMIRKLLIIVSAVIAPVAFSGATADITNGWVRKWIEMVTALASAKLILIVIFMVGVSVLDGAGSTGQGGGNALTQTVIGALILLLGGFAPWLAIKMVHFTGDSFHAMHAHAGAATAGAATVIAAPQKVSSLVAQGQQMKAQVSKLDGSNNGSVPGAKSAAPTPYSSSGPGSAPIGGNSTRGAAAGAGAAGGAGPAAIAVLAGAAAVKGAKSASTAAATTGQELTSSQAEAEPPAPPPKAH